MKFDFQLGTPFTPFQQLMGVLPEDSKEHVPSAYRVCRSLKTGADGRT
jgi:5'-3' exoribonuclease 1